MRWIRCAALTSVALISTACVYAPNFVHRYDRDCQIMVRQAELELATVNRLNSCDADRCVVSVLEAGLVSVGSAVISGSIVLVSNTAFWIEKQRDCQPLNKGVPEQDLSEALPKT